MSAGDVFWFRYDPRDTAQATGRMTLAQKGAHHALLEIAWSRPSCSIPADDDWMRRRLGITADEFARDVRPVLDTLWTLEGDPPNADWVSDWLRGCRQEAAQRSHAARTSAMARHYPDKIHPLKPKEKP
ncbi:DUF1376 domain-containing protein [Limibaculum sp. M0105]|uniref:DUF1376 domain-containing protein n=1 Tax=Thermohalobaculum xanthum TaxID=2753746 RepID=A0A8J7MA84_9RHOB|nr:DUF1376 domain-containing protein [Thermohalobaculum xanthum]MBK0400635.1 DUF1376 domain-containing protein [Thermohalobaculum xanthum]